MPAATQATIASKMMTERMEYTINSKADLMGRPVGTWQDEVGLVRKYGMKAVGFGEGCVTPLQRAAAAACCMSHTRQ